MSKIVCRICLRSDFTRSKDVDATLADFHDELCDFDVFAKSMTTFCPLCENLLQNFYNFKVKCKKANKLLKTWKKKKKTLESLYKELSAPSLELCTEQAVFESKNSDLTPTTQYNSESVSEHKHTDLNPISEEVTVKVEDVDLTTKIDNDSILIIQELKLDTNTDVSSILKQEHNGIDSEVKKESDCSDSELYESDDDFKLNSIKNSEDIDSANSSDEDLLKVKKKFEKRNQNKRKNIEDDALSDEKVNEKISKRRMYCKNPEKLKNRILELIEQGEFKDLGSNINIDKDIFVNMFDKCNLNGLKGMLPERKSSTEIPKIRKLLLYLLKRYHPKYETVFDIEYLDTMAKKIAEFKARKHSREYTEAKFKCPICFKVFEAENKLNYHNKWHESSQPHVCDICRMRFISRTTLTVHCKNNHCTVYRCKQCPVITYNFGAMVNHYDHHKGVEYACPVCLSTFRNKSSMNTHRLLAHKTSHICPLCARSFVSEKGLYLHTKLKHREEASASMATVACDQCTAKFTSPEVLQKHIKEAHWKSSRSKCGQCKRIFPSLEELRQHKLATNHTGPARRSASWQGRSARPPQQRVNVFGPDKPYRTCPICLVEVPNTHHTALYKHYVSVHPEEPYNAHADSLDYLCEQCGKGFRVLSLYKDHLNKHSGLRPYECSECGARFAALHQLRAHQTRHRPPRYQCKDCGKLFLTAANLSSHRRTHIGDRRYKCEICFKGFLHGSSLKEHVRGVHHQIRRVKNTRKQRT